MENFLLDNNAVEIAENFTVISETFTALIAGILVFILVSAFIAIPVLLIRLEYRLTKQHYSYGLLLMIVPCTSFIIFGVYSVFVVLLLLVAFFIALSDKTVKNNITSGK